VRPGLLPGGGDGVVKDVFRTIVVGVGSANDANHGEVLAVVLRGCV
jgi:hypothetical protein